MYTTPQAKFSTLTFLHNLQMGKKLMLHYLHYARQGRFAKDKHSSLLHPLVSYKANEVKNTTPGAVISTINFLLSLQKGLIS